MTVTLVHGRLARMLPNLCAIAGMLLYYYIWYMEYPFFFAHESSAGIWGMSLLALLAVVPRRQWRVAVALWLLAAWGLFYVNTFKAELMGLPLTELDFWILGHNPIGFLDAMGVSPYLQIGLLLVACGLFAFLVVRIWRQRGQALYAELAARCILLVAAAFLFGSFYSSYGEYLYDNKSLVLGSTCEWWNIACPVNASKSFGVLGFLAYTHEEAKHRLTLFQRFGGTSSSGADREVTPSVIRKFMVNRNVEGPAPNIVFVLAESTFNPKDVFNVEGEDFPLFSSRAGRHEGVLHVTPVGGGTWRTEFETITGLDSRLFGTMGDYTHLTLAPWVKESYATYLVKRGYSTGAFYPVSGKFYEARKAYAHYGFQSFLDVDDLGLEKDWTKFSDERMAEVVAPRFPDEGTQPFFRYVVFLENHWPHLCRKEQVDVQQIRFKKQDKFKDCVLQEYARRLASTTRGFEKIVARLQEIENKTGRPYIVVIFGDHQPASLVTPAFNENRTALSMQHTFYLVAASKKLALPDVSQTFHATLLPTFVSSVTAKTEQDVYLPENLELFDRCGEVANPSDCPVLGRVIHAYKRYIGL